MLSATKEKSLLHSTDNLFIKNPLMEKSFVKNVADNLDMPLVLGDI